MFILKLNNKIVHEIDDGNRIHKNNPNTKFELIE